MISLFAKYKERIIQLPVNPEELTITGKANNRTTNIVSMGEITNIGFPNLQSLSIESFFPMKEASYVNTNGSFEKPDFYINFFKEIKKDRQPFRLIITELDINMLVSIESFEHTYAYGTDDVDYTLDLKEYKEHNVRILAPKIETPMALVTAPVNNAPAPVTNTNEQNVAPVAPTVVNSDRPVEKEIPKTYTIVSGDTLWKIAQKLLGNGSRWNDVYTYSTNKKIIGGNPNLIRVGQVLAIPPASYVGPKVSVGKTVKKTYPLKELDSNIYLTYDPTISAAFGGGGGGF